MNLQTTKATITNMWKNPRNKARAGTLRIAAVKFCIGEYKLAAFHELKIIRKTGVQDHVQMSEFMDRCFLCTLMNEFA